MPGCQKHQKLTFSVVKIVKNNDNVNVNANYLIKHEDTKKFNDNVNANLNYGFKSLFTLSGWDTKIPVMLQCTVVDALQGEGGGEYLENLFQR